MDTTKPPRATEQTDDDGMADARHLAHVAARHLAEHLTAQGVPPGVVISAMFGVAAGELAWREGGRLAAATIRDFANAIEAHGPRTLDDIEAAGNA